jgi:hypothetical protein
MPAGGCAAEQMAGASDRVQVAKTVGDTGCFPFPDDDEDLLCFESKYVYRKSILCTAMRSSASWVASR